MAYKLAVPGSQRVPVVFSFPGTIWAETVHPVGDFNGWNCEAHPMLRTENDWHITLELERDRRYHFRYLLDGTRWCNDWSADHYTPNSLGGYDSVLAT